MNQYITYDINFRDKIDIEELNKNIDSFIKRNPSIDFVLNVPSSKGATSSFVQKLHPKVKNLPETRG